MKSNADSWPPPAALADPSGADSAPSPVWFRIGPVKVTRRRALAGAVVIASLVAVAWFWGRPDMQAVHAQAERLPLAWVLALLVVLPLVGFPVSWLHLAAGVRFDFWPGLAVVLVTSLAQSILAWSLVRVVPPRFFSKLAPWRRRLEGAGHRDAVLFCGLVPGMPYAVQLYLLPVIGVPLRLLCLWGVTLNTARATATILLGNLSGHLSPARLGLLVAYYAALAGVSACALRHLRGSLRRTRGENSGLSPFRPI